MTNATTTATATDYAALSDRELDAMAHELVFDLDLTGTTAFDVAPNYCSSFDSAALLKDECDRKGLFYKFAFNVKNSVDPIKATPRDWTIAAIKAVEGNPK